MRFVKSTWTQPETTFAGKYNQLSRADCDPKPLQSPHPPVWIGGGGDPDTESMDLFASEVVPNFR